MASLGTVRARAMFGGHGIYLDDTLFAIVADDQLWFKTDAAGRACYRNAGLAPFTYVARGRRIALSYHAAPPDVFESAEIMRRHALDALGAAQRARRRKS